MIEIKQLTKRYGTHVAVSDMSCTIESGRIYGLLGPNGAGKSTTMNIITGCLAATEGEVFIGGHDIFEEAEAAKRLIGYLPEQPPLYQDMTPQEYLMFVAKAKRVPKQERDRQIDEVVSITQIDDVRHRLIRNLSKGYRQRVGIAQALLGNPEVIVLDEPTVGLDPLQIIEIRDLIKSLGAKHTVILSSHILSEVRAICDHVLIISHGRLVASDTPENLERLFAGTSTLTLTVRATETEVRTALAGVDGIGEITYEKVADTDQAWVDIRIESGTDPSEAVFFAFSDIRRPILRMTQSQASLEEVFRELTSDADAQPEVAPQEEASKPIKSADTQEGGAKDEA